MSLEDLMKKYPNALPESASPSLIQPIVVGVALLGVCLAGLWWVLSRHLHRRKNRPLDSNKTSEVGSRPHFSERHLVFAFMTGLILGVLGLSLIVGRYEITSSGNRFGSVIKLDKLTGKAWQQAMGGPWQPIREE